MQQAVYLAAVVAVMGVAGALLRIATDSVAHAAEAAPAGSGAPVVLELYTSQGCSSCPPADALLQTWAGAGSVEGVPVIPLAFHVDYWNRLGWRDPFSQDAFTSRQEAYAAAWGKGRIYTPQLVIDGAADVVGSDGRGAAGAIRQAAQRPKQALTLQSAIEGDMLRLSISGMPDSLPAGARLFVAITEEHLSSDVRAGENKGRTLHHSAVVRNLQEMPATTTKIVIELDAAWKKEDLSAVAFLQRPGGPILAAGMVKRPA